VLDQFRIMVKLFPADHRPRWTLTASWDEPAGQRVHLRSDLTPRLTGQGGNTFRRTRHPGGQRL
jgi:hypothetical protein